MPLAACRPPLGAGLARRGGDAQPYLPSPITSGALNSCRSPGCLSQGPPGCRVTAHGAAGRCPSHPAPRGCWQRRAASSRCMHPAPTPAPSMHWGTFGDPRAGGFVYLHYKAEGWELSTGHRSIPPAVPSTHSAADPESLVPLGMPVPSLPGKSPTLAPKTGSVVYPHVMRCIPTGTWGLTILTYFPGGCSKA